MNELLEILAVARRLRAAGRAYLVATVVKIGGSSYRRPGARMLIDDRGQTWGTISGGCLEAEVAQQALALLAEGRPRLVPFDLGEDDLVLGFGTGCDGTVHVFIAPVPAAPKPGVLDLFEQCIDTRRRGVLVTVIDAAGTLAGDLGAHLLLDEAGDLTDGLAGSALRDEVLEAAQALLEIEQTEARTYLWHTRVFTHKAGTAEVLLEVVRPPIRLFVFGEGHDVHGLVRLAKSVGWTVVVVGRKPAEVLAQRFPEADAHLFLMHPEDALRQMTPDARSAAVVMNHTYVRDRALLAVLLNTALPYVGLLGPRERTARMLAELTAEGTAPTAAQRQRLFGPLGLDIGTETPEEIALSAIAEIQAVLHHRAGGSLRARREPIHDTRSTRRR